MKTNNKTAWVPESQICQHCAGMSCRSPAAHVSHRSYSQSTQTRHSRRRLHSPGSAGSRLQREDRLKRGTLLSARSGEAMLPRQTKTKHTKLNIFTLAAAQITQVDCEIEGDRHDCVILHHTGEMRMLHCRWTTKYHE